MDPFNTHKISDRRISAVLFYFSCRLLGKIQGSSRSTKIGDDIHVSVCEHTEHSEHWTMSKSFILRAKKFQHMPRITSVAMSWKEEKNDERTKEEEDEEEDTVFGEYLKLKRKRRHLLAFNRKPQHKQSFRNVPHSLDQNFICSILCVDYNSVNDAGRFIYSCPHFLSSDPISPVLWVCVCVQYVHHEIFKSSQTTMHRMVGEAKVVEYLSSTSSARDLHVCNA